MVVVKVCMWPLGRRTHERVLCVAAIDCVGVAREDGPDVRKGERAYRVRLFKGVQFGGPDGSKDLPIGAKTWRTGGVRGHVPGGHGAAARGEWDLLAGALNAVLGSRIDGYVACDAGARRAAVYCFSGYRSPDWRAFCEEPAADPIQAIRDAYKAHKIASTAVRDWTAAQPAANHIGYPDAPMWGDYVKTGAALESAIRTACDPNPTDCPCGDHERSRACCACPCSKGQTPEERLALYSERG